MTDMTDPNVDPWAGDGFHTDFGLTGEKRQPETAPPGFREWDGKPIAQPGAYLDVPIEFYHGNEPCSEPSISSSGLKKLAGDRAGQRKGMTPLHFWHDSPLNPNRPTRVEKRHFSVGKAAHDILLLGERWPDFYHVTPEGFSRAKTKAMADEIAEADAALAEGLTILSTEDAIAVQAMAEALRRNPLALALLSNGHPEVTLVHRDRETGVLVRTRPDFLPHKRLIIPDLKTAADASHDGFQSAIGKNGYAQAAALYMDAIEVVFGEKPTNWIHVAIEKAEPYCVALWELPAEDIERGRWLNARALRTFADCLASGKWPGYADTPAICGLPGWARKVIDEGGSGRDATDPPAGWMDNADEEN